MRAFFALVVWSVLLCGVTECRSEENRPLLEARVPLPWSVDGVDPELGSRFRNLILSSMANTGDPLFKSRSQLLRLINKRLELSLYEPHNPLLPIPSVKLDLPSENPEAMLAVLQEWVKREIESNLKIDTSWLQFRPSSSEEDVLEAFVMAGMIWLVKEDWGVQVLFSSRANFRARVQKDKKFVEDLSGAGQLWLRAETKKTLSVYRPWIERARGLSLGKAGEYISKLSHLELSSRGEGATYQWSLELFPEKTGKSLAKKIDWPRQPRLPKLMGDEMLSASVLIPEGSGNQILDLIPEGMLNSADHVSELFRLFLTNLESLAVSMNRSTSVPVFSFRVKEKLQFKKELSLWASKGKGVVGMDPDFKELHVGWSATTLSMREEKEEFLLAPFRQVLLDEVAGLRESSEQDPLWLKVPLRGTKKGVYYAALHGSLALSELWSGPVDPNLVPSFSESDIEDQPWESYFELRMKAGEDSWSFELKAPYGPLGLVSSLELQTSSLLYVLSLYNLSRNSWKGR